MTDFVVSAGQPIRATHITQFSRWLTAATKSHTTAITNTHATEHTLTLTNEVATGGILKLGYGTGTAVAAQFGATLASFSTPVTFASSVTFAALAPLTLTSSGATAYTLTVQSANTSAAPSFRVLDAAGSTAIPMFAIQRESSSGNYVVSINHLNGTVPTATTFLVGKSATSSHVMADFALTVAGSGADSGAMRAVVTQTGGTNLVRAGEFRGVRHTGASAGGGFWGIEVNLSGVPRSTVATDAVGIYIANGSGLGGETRANSGLWIGGTAGWDSYLNCVTSDNSTVVFGIASTGQVQVASGTAAAPAYAFKASTIDGMYLLGAGSLGFAANGGRRLALSATVMQVEQPLFMAHATAGVTAAGYDTAFPKPDGRWYHANTSGEYQFMDSALVARRNILINGDFQVWQDGNSPTGTNNAYGPDQWRLLAETNTSATISRGSSAVMTGAGHFNAVLTVGAGNNNKLGIFQPIEGVTSWPLRGTVASLQAKILVSNVRIGSVKMAILQWASTEDGVSATPINAWGGEGTNPTLTTWTFANTPTDATSGSITPTTTAVLYKVENVAISATSTNLGVMIWSDDKSQTAADTLTISDVQLEAGAVCTQFERRHKTLEESLCYRYYYRLFPATNAAVFGFGQAYSTASARIYVSVPSVMRTTPSFSVATASDFALTTNNFALTSSPSDVSLYAWQSNIATVNVGTGPTNLAAGDCTMLLTGSTGGTTGTLRFSARL